MSVGLAGVTPMGTFLPVQFVLFGRQRCPGQGWRSLASLGQLVARFGRCLLGLRGSSDFTPGLRRASGRSALFFLGWGVQIAIARLFLCVPRRARVRWSGNITVYERKMRLGWEEPVKSTHISGRGGW